MSDSDEKKSTKSDDATMKEDEPEKKPEKKKDAFAVMRAKASVSKPKIESKEEEDEDVSHVKVVSKGKEPDYGEELNGLTNSLAEIKLRRENPGWDEDKLTTEVENLSLSRFFLVYGKRAFAFPKSAITFAHFKSFEPVKVPTRVELGKTDKLKAWTNGPLNWRDLGLGWKNIIILSLKDVHGKTAEKMFMTVVSEKEDDEMTELQEQNVYPDGEACTDRLRLLDIPDTVVEKLQKEWVHGDANREAVPWKKTKQAQLKPLLNYKPGGGFNPTTSARSASAVAPSSFTAHDSGSLTLFSFPSLPS